MASYTVTLAGGTPATSGSKTTSVHDALTRHERRCDHDRGGHGPAGAGDVDQPRRPGTSTFRLDGTAAVAGAVNTFRVKAGTQAAFPAAWCSAGSVSVVGSGGNETYEVNVFPYDPRQKD